MLHLNSQFPSLHFWSGVPRTDFGVPLLVSHSRVLGLLHTGVRHIAVQGVGPGDGLLLCLLIRFKNGPLGASDGGCRVRR